MRSRFVGIALVTALMAAAPAPAGAKPRAHRGCANADTPAVATTNRAMRSAILCLVNRQRAAHHLPGLSEDGRLDRSAQGWTVQMVLSGIFSHGTDFAARISGAGYSWSSAGENIASGFATPREVVGGWMASTGHCQNILNPTYLNIGIGVSRRGVSPGIGASTWTQDFGLPMGHAAPSGNWGPANGCPY